MYGRSNWLKFHKKFTSIYKSPNLFVKVNEARLSSTMLWELHRGKAMAAIPKNIAEYKIRPLSNELKI